MHRSSYSFCEVSGLTELPKSLFGYNVLKHIGNGAGSRIYAVTKPGTGQTFALKHVVRSDEKSIRFVEQIQNEFSVGKNVKSKYLRASIDLHVHRSLMLRVNEAALIMEYVDGTPLDVSLPRRVSDILAVFYKTAKAILALHEAGLVHCDLKPGNILTSEGGSVKVIDLGQTCPIGTVKARIQGTPDYIAPEQVKCKSVLPQTDIFNFGASLYWCLTGKKLPTLFTIKKGENSFLVDTQLPTPASLNPLVPENLSAFVMECVKSNPLKRPENMGLIMTRLDLIHRGVLKLEADRRSSVA
jgi:serine/threonine-protein kinase